MAIGAFHQTENTKDSNMTTESVNDYLFTKNGRNLQICHWSDWQIMGTIESV